MKTLDLNQLTVESFDVSTADSFDVQPIVSTDQVPDCDGYSADGNC